MLRNLAIALLLLAFRALTLIILHPNIFRPDLIRGSLAPIEPSTTWLQLILPISSTCTRVKLSDQEGLPAPAGFAII